ncbi:MAG: hypothetical protein ACRDDJ_11905 [[Mycobacterium] stephanolepidis]
MLPDHIFAYPQPYPGVVRTAMIDSFFVTVRALLEFLLIRPSGHASDFTAASTLPGWTPQLTPTQKTDLIKRWNDVSAHLVHFSSQRPMPVEVNEAQMRALAADVLAVWDQFAAASQHTLVPLAVDNHRYDVPAAGAAT